MLVRGTLGSFWWEQILWCIDPKGSKYKQINDTREVRLPGPSSLSVEKRPDSGLFVFVALSRTAQEVTVYDDDDGSRTFTIQIYYITLASCCNSLKAAESINPFYSTKIFICTYQESGSKPSCLQATGGSHVLTFWTRNGQQHAEELGRIQAW